MMKRIIALLLLLMVVMAGQAALADRGSIPFSPNVQIFEPGQKGIIGWNGSEEVLILSTDLHASKETEVLEVIPLPSEPKVRAAEPDIFRRTDQLLLELKMEDFLKKAEVHRSKGSTDGRSLPSGEVTQQKTVGAHDISVTRVKETAGFVDWVEGYLSDRGVQSVEIPRPLKQAIKEYLQDGFSWFVFDIVKLDQTKRTNTGIQYRFKSDSLYYPLKISRTESGRTNIKLTIFSSQVLNGFIGLGKDRVNINSNHYLVEREKVDEISPELAGLFSTKDSSGQRRIHLYDWKIGGEISSFKDDLLVKTDPVATKELTFLGTKFINCHPAPDYPFSTDKPVKTITGTITERMGSRMYPWRAATVNGVVLFNPLTNDLLRNYNELLGERVSITGYPGRGSIKMRNPFDKQEEVINFKRVFYVTNIIGWDYICGDSTNEEGEVVTPDVHFWYPASK